VTPTPSRAVQLLQSLLHLGPLLVLAACGGNGSSSSSSTSSSGSSSGDSTATVPGAPTLYATSVADRKATLGFTSPTDTGGATVSSFEATCAASSSDTHTVTGSASPITVDGLTNATSYDCTVKAVNSLGSGDASVSKSLAPTATPDTTDTTKLPLGDNLMVTAAPASTARGYLYSCSTPDSSQPGTTNKGPWFNSDGTTWNLGTKLPYAVEGADSWASSFATSIVSSLRSITFNGVPSHGTGQFPITSATSPMASQYDTNGNKIVAASTTWTGLKTSPTVNSTPTCLGKGAIGVFLTGARLFAAMDAKGRDARAWEVTDACEGHPAPGNNYHYHSMPTCGLAADTASQHSALIGYVADGFGLYGKQGDNGKILTNADLDECHGHTDTAVPQYHYHATEQFPYTVGCYRGTPITSHN